MADEAVPTTRGATGIRLAAYVRERWDLVLASSLCAVLGVAFIAQSALVVDGLTYFSLADDVMISMTYAKTFADGHGLVWFPGAERVEGYTNPLWTVWFALLHVLSPVDRFVPLLAALSGLVALIVGLFGVDALSRRLGTPPTGRLFALLAASTLYAPAFWALRGFEVSVLLALVTWMIVLALDGERRGWKFGALLGLMGGVCFLIRMDALVLCGAIIFLRVLPLASDKIDVRRVIEEWLAAGAVMILVAASLVAARYAYYGDILPNTAYLKLGGAPLPMRVMAGLKVDLRAGLEWAPLGLLALAPLLWLWRGPRSLFLAYTGALFVVAIQFAYTAFIGGDAWEWSGFPDRFLSTVAFPLCACAGVGAGWLAGRVRVDDWRRWLVPAGLAIVAFGWTSLEGWQSTFAGRGFQIREEKRMVETGLYMNRATAPGFSYALTWAGTIPYYAEGGKPVDLLGKMDKVIARVRPTIGEANAYHPGHNKFDVDHSIGVLRPDAVIHPVWSASPADPVAAKLRAWGYETTRGGWWIHSGQTSKVLDPGLFDFSFGLEAYSFLTGTDEAASQQPK